MLRRASLFLLAAFLWTAYPAAAQDAPVTYDPASVSEASRQLLEEGIEAFRDERFAEAEATLQRAIAADARNAEAHYMLARVYYETPLFDKGAAGEQVARARELDPSNIEFMVAELQQLRLPSWNNVAELIQQSKRQQLARAILAVDSTNAFAHEELGASYIRDFWQYRNAIAIPNLTLPSERNDLENPEPGRREVLVGQGDAPGTGSGEGSIVSDPLLERTNFGGEGQAVDIDDRFDLATLQAQNVAVLDLSKRADRAYEQAIGHLRKALEYDPRRRTVYDHLMRIYTLKGEFADAQDVLSQMYVFFPEDPEMWMYLGLANHRLGQSEAAAKSFEQAFERLDPEDRAAIESLTLFLDDGERARYETDSTSFAAQFWTSQDPRYLTPYNERRLEHYARLVHADLLYAADDIGLRGWDTQRGQIIVRYGPPNSDVTITGNFGEVISGFGLVADASDVGSSRRFGERFDMVARSNLFNVWDYGDFKLVFEDPLRNGEFRLYSPPADFFGDPSAGFVEKMDYEMIARERFREEPERYEYRSPGRDVRLPYVVTAFKGEDGGADLYVHYGIPIGDTADLGDDLIGLNVRTGTFLIDDDTRDVVAERRRTLYGLKTSQVVTFDEARLWADTQALTSAPGSATVSVEFETAGGGAEAAQRRTVEVPDFAAETFAVSDLMLAYQIEEVYDEGEEGVNSGRLRRGDVEIFPAPWSVFSNTQPIYVYFETYGLDQNAAGQNQYAVEVTLKPKDQSSGIARLAKRVFGGDDGGVSVEFEAGSTGPDDATYTIINAEDLEPGLYTLTLRVRDTLTGATAERTRDLYLE